MKVINEKKINLIIVNKGEKIEIEKNIYLKILWPNDRDFIGENKLNNNSIVCKFYYKEFSILFTGDIEKLAEEKILEKYKNNLRILNSDILKVAHHRI